MEVTDELNVSNYEKWRFNELDSSSDGIQGKQE